jgi:hypothetical protein
MVPWFKPESGHAGFVLDRVALGQVFSEYFGSPCKTFHRLFHTDYHHPWSGSSTVDQIVADVPSGLILIRGCISILVCLSIFPNPVCSFLHHISAICVTHHLDLSITLSNLKFILKIFKNSVHISQKWHYSIITKTVGCYGNSCYLFY